MLDKKEKKKSPKFGDKDAVYAGGHGIYLNDIEKVENNFVYLKTGNKILVSEVEAVQVKKILG